ncbi:MULTISPECIES: glutamyl-tRNA reductase [unclassified Zunongwangia]|uniref:glutamyl-tRNA reductase n=1 Tax=unclassified Zunongwangia TaxID=2632541 RepID=UPI0022DD1CFB|nr:MULTISPECIES: glutamyl-tRNA reductase [unclassified Zunongwangia]WBL22455.1 glutamyl-tRNA reductase [Zunongwangia sp. HRR-M8]WBL25596.1 glutamyl-tRNA reductase [Zunongwangia sp. HGR-M22]
MESLISKGRHFYTIGLSYKKADAEIRGHFSLTEEAKSKILIQAKREGIDGVLLTSTCNRTEIYGFAEHPFQLIKLLCEHTHGTVEEFEKVAYVYKSKQAISHLFRVGTGLDSQILGDFEIISQIKLAFAQSKKVGLANAFTERLVNAVIQASKRIKNETEISSGATSVSFASVQYILQNIEDVSNKNILLFGTGKIGRNTCENLIKHTQNKHITLINRTKDKAEKIAGKFSLTVKDYADLQAEIRNTDVLIVATGAQNPTISKELLYCKKDLLILDLSIPKNVAEDVEELDNVKLVHLDHLSQITDETLQRRKKFIPEAEIIIAEVQAEFCKWLETRKFAPTIKALKKKLRMMKDAELDFQRKKIEDFNDEQAEIVSNRIIQKIMKQFANHLKEDSNTTDESLELIQKVFQLEEQAR